MCLKSYHEFVDDLIGSVCCFVRSHWILVVLPFFVVLSILIGKGIYSHLLEESFDGSKLVPLVYGIIGGPLSSALALLILTVTFVGLFSGADFGPANGNANMAVCLIMLVVIPCLWITYLLYFVCGKLVIVSKSKFPYARKRACETSVDAKLANRVAKLSSLRSKGIITDRDFADQLSKLVSE